MKNIILILVLCFTINNIKAQQFSGIYMQPSSPNDIVINTASYISGIYFLKPMGISNIKSIKFIIK